jgi:hypothetical protein
MERVEIRTVTLWDRSQLTINVSRGNGPLGVRAMTIEELKQRHPFVEIDNDLDVKYQAGIDTYNRTMSILDWSSWIMTRMVMPLVAGVLISYYFTEVFMR